MPPSPKPFVELLEFQKIILSAYFAGVGDKGEASPFKLNKKDGVAKDWRDCSLLAQFCLKHHCSSEAAGNNLLQSADLFIRLYDDLKSTKGVEAIPLCVSVGFLQPIDINDSVGPHTDASKFLASKSADNKEGDSFCGTHHGRFGMSCRCCTSMTVWSIDW